MHSIAVMTLQPNSFFDAPVYLEEDFILLTPETLLTEELINCLKEWKYNEVFTNGTVKQVLHDNHADKTDEDISQIDKVIQDKEKYKTSLNFYFDLIKFVEELNRDFIYKNILSSSEITQKIKEIIKIIKSNRDMVLSFIGMKHDVENYFLTHAVNTTIMALAIGDFLKFPPHRLIELGIATFLHEIGMLKLPHALCFSKKVFSAEEKKKMSAHTILGYKILKGMNFSENVALCALEHHERKDGSGYPSHQKGEAIFLYARIISVVCSYEAMIKKRPYKTNKIPQQSILELLIKNKTVYDDNILKAFVQCISLYPLGSYVLMNNNAIGIVFRTTPGKPKYPYVKLIRDPNRNKINEQVVIETSQEKKVVITRSLNWEEIKVLEA